MTAAVRCLRRTLVLLLYVFLCIHPSLGQEKPTLQLDSFNYSVSYRQSVCERQARIDNGTLQLRNALTGLQLSTYVPVDNRYFYFNETIDPDNPGLVAHILDEVAERGKFTWRDSFGVLASIEIPENQTFNDLLGWSVWAYDVSAAYWLKTIARMEKGVTYPSGWYDGRVIMVGLLEPEGSSGLDLWSFLEPFSAGVWIMIAVTVVVSGLIYWFLDWFDTDSDRLNLDKDPGQSVFLALLSFTGHFEFKPMSSSARLFTASLSFWALIMMSAYTANLASYLVVQNTPSIEIDTVGDAVRNNYRFCVIRSTAPDNALSAAWPEARVIRTQTEREIYEGVRDGKCEVLLTPMSSWNEYQGDKTVNGDCRLTWIGRTFSEGEGGFATKSDSGTLCSSLIRDVLNLHMEEMKADGFVSRAWNEFLERRKTVDCTAEFETEEGDDSGQLTLQAMGGTFIIHYIVTAIAVLVAFAWKCKKKYQPSTHARWKLSARNLTGGDHPTAAPNKSGDGNRVVEQSRSSANGTDMRLEDLVERQNEKLSALLATINDMKTELNDMCSDETRREGEKEGT